MLAFMYNMNLENKQPIKTGTWLYDGNIPCEVRIVPHNILYGSGDYEDPPEIGEDQEVDCFYILFHTPFGNPKWAGGGAVLTLPEAIALVETKVKGLIWHD